MAPMSQQSKAEKRREDADISFIAQQLYATKRCECGTPLSNDDWECPECGLAPEDIAAEATLVAMTYGITDPVAARASRATH